MVKPVKFAHVVYQTRRFDEMIAWYREVFEADVVYQNPALAFLTYADEANPRIALAVLIRGNSSRIKGPLAAGVAGHIYRRLREQNYFAQTSVAQTSAPQTLSDSGAAFPAERKPP